MLLLLLSLFSSSELHLDPHFVPVSSLAIFSNLLPTGNMSSCSRVIGYARLEEGLRIAVRSWKFSGFVGGGYGRLSCARKVRAFVVMSTAGPDKGSDFGVEVSEVRDDFVGRVRGDVKLVDGDDGEDVYRSNGRFLDGGGGGNDDGGGGGGGGRDGDGDGEEEELGRLLKFEEVIQESEARGFQLPRDMLEAAKSVGLRKVLLERYLDLQGAVWPTGFATRSCSMLRNRMLADPSFLFKVGAEILIDSSCATIAEVQKRGKDFWQEFELYVADLLVGVVVNIALVGMLAPYARIGQPAMAKGLLGHLQHAYAALPSSVFEAERPEYRFSVNQRLATYFFKGILYGAVGFGCGIVGQGIANFIMTTKRNLRKSEEDIPVPPLFKSAALWGVFLAVSSNTRYQIINGLERLVEASPVAKQVPPVAMAFTVGIRFSNNIYGGMQFVDWARLTGVQ